MSILIEQGYVLRVYTCLLIYSVVSDSLWPHGLEPTRFLCPWDLREKNTGVDCHFFLQGIFPTQGSNSHLLLWQADSLLPSHLGSHVCICAKLSQTLCKPVDYSQKGSSLHGILQARILEWVAISLSRGSSQPRDQTWVFHVAGRHFTIWATREAHSF